MDPGKEDATRKRRSQSGSWAVAWISGWLAGMVVSRGLQRFLCFRAATPGLHQGAEVPRYFCQFKTA
jgi:hypothetical protein